MASIRFNNVLISGLRRSGTTVFWETFRQDSRLLCFDEPFHPCLWSDPGSNHKGTWTELLDVRSRSGMKLPLQAAIAPLDELSTDATTEQQEYLCNLFAQHSRVIVDCVRTWSKLQVLSDTPNPPLIIHLVRHPTTWVTAHLLPSSRNPGYRMRMANIYRRLSFFHRYGFYNNWQYQDIIDASLRSKPHQTSTLWDEIDKSAAEIAAQPAYRKLLALWWAAVRRTESQLASLPPERHVTVTMEEFQTTPNSVFESLYQKAGWTLDNPMTFDHITRSRAAWADSSQHWQEGMHWAGIPESLFSLKQFTGYKITKAIGGAPSDYLA